MKIKKGDKVKILAGKDKGKTGKVLQVFVDKNKVSVEGVNLLYKNARPRKQGEKGQKIQFPAAMNVSNVALIDPKTNKPTRVGYQVADKSKNKQRIAKKSKEII